MRYILARYPNGFDSGAPTDYYTAAEGRSAVEIAGEIIEFCKNILAGQGSRKAGDTGACKRTKQQG